MVKGERTLIQQTSAINENTGDPEMLCGLYHDIATGFGQSPKLRLTWLGNLKELHVKVHPPHCSHDLIPSLFPPLLPAPSCLISCRMAISLRRRSASSSRPRSSSAL